MRTVNDWDADIKGLDEVERRDSKRVAELLKNLLGHPATIKITVETATGVSHTFSRPPTDVRFRRHVNARWSQGRFIRYNDNGTVDFSDLKNGASRTMSAKNVEVKQRGPRGGTVWVPISESAMSA